MCVGPFAELTCGEHAAHTNECLLHLRRTGRFCLLLSTTSPYYRSLSRTQSDRSIRPRTTAPIASILLPCGKYHQDVGKRLRNYSFFSVLGATPRGPRSRKSCRARLHAILEVTLLLYSEMRLCSLILLAMDMDTFAYTTLFLRPVLHRILCDSEGASPRLAGLHRRGR